MKLNLLTAATLAAISTTSISQAALVYREVFGTTVDAAPLSSVNWTAVNELNADPGAGTALSNLEGNPMNLPNVGQAQVAASETNGFVFTSSSKLLASTMEYDGSIALTRESLTSISFFQGNSNSSTIDYRVALQVNSQWYASVNLGASTSVGSASNFDTGATQLSLIDFTSSNWALITQAPGSLTRGTNDQALPSGNISSFGVYLEKPGGLARFDTFEINAIPEPSSTALLGLALLAGFSRRRR